MQILILDEQHQRSRSLMLSRGQVAAIALAVLLALMLLSGAIYQVVFLRAVRDGWPVVSQLVKLVIRDESAQRDKVLRENLDAMAQKVGEMQAKLVRMEALSDRIGGLAGVKADDLKILRGPGEPNASRPGTGGPYLPLDHPSMEQLDQALQAMAERSDIHADVLTLIESHLFESRLRTLMVPNTWPVSDAAVGSGFGFRADPFTGRPALHTGLDFSAPPGTTVVAAASGVVQSAETHPQYGRTLEIDHGNGLVTRYAHLAAYLVKPGDLVRRGQAVARVGNSGRSTGPHLHFEVLVEGAPQNPNRFLSGLASGGAARPAKLAAQASNSAR